MSAEILILVVGLSISMVGGIITMVYVGARGIEAINGLKRSVDELRDYMRLLDTKVNSHTEQIARLEGTPT